MVWQVAAGGRGGGESRSDVIGNIAADGCVLFQSRSVAGHAVGRIQRVVIVDVAGRAGRGCGRLVRANESETRNCVIERSRVPTFGGVAIGTIGGSESQGRKWSERD